MKKDNTNPTENTSKQYMKKFFPINSTIKGMNIDDNLRGVMRKETNIVLDKPIV